MSFYFLAVKFPLGSFYNFHFSAEFLNMHLMSLITSSFVILETSSDNYSCGFFPLCFSTMILVLFFIMSPPVCVCVYTSTLIFYNALRDNIKPKMLIMLISFSRKNFSFLCQDV